MRLSNDDSTAVCSGTWTISASPLDPTRFASAEGLRRGAYVLLEAPGGLPDVIVIGTGAETGLAAQAVERLQSEGIMARAASMPSWELFEDQEPSCRDAVLPPGVHARLAVEAGVARAKALLS